MEMQEIEYTPVLIVGASMVGMTLGTLLAQHGIRGCIAMEKHSSTAIHPRAAVLQPRTMTIYREMGLYGEMSKESKMYYDERAAVVAVDCLAGKLLKVFMRDINEGIEDISPVMRLFLTQQTFEPMFRRKAKEEGLNIQFSTKLLSFEQDSSGVTALVQNVETGSVRKIRSTFLIGCDGGKSLVRNVLGIQLYSRGILSRSVTIYFNADVKQFLDKHNYSGVVYIHNKGLQAFIRCDKHGKEGFLCVLNAGSDYHPADTISEEKAKEYLRIAVGQEIPMEITHIGKWNAVTDVAEQFRSGRGFLAGDSAHTVPPQGGFGGNTGIQDAHNLAWKTALVLQGKAGIGLINQTYQDERFPICKKTVDQVYTRYAIRSQPDLLKKPGNEAEEEIPDWYLELGYLYHSKAILNEHIDMIVEDPGTAIARPGTLAHHVMISTVDGKYQNIPISDLFGRSFVLLAGSDGRAWEAATEEYNSKAGEQKLPIIDVQRIESGSKFQSRYNITATGAVLVRPDHWVAWVAKTDRIEAPADSNGFSNGDTRKAGLEEKLSEVMTRLLWFDV